MFLVRSGDTNYVSRQMEKQCRGLDPEALELVQDIAKRILEMNIDKTTN